MNPARKDLGPRMFPIPSDQRREVRVRAEGVANVRLRFPQPGAWTQVELVDISAGGFRLAHADTSFAAGQELEFEHPYAAGTARVVWNRILNGHVESGCMILPRL